MIDVYYSIARYFPYLGTFNEYTPIGTLAYVPNNNNYSLEMRGALGYIWQAYSTLSDYSRLAMSVNAFRNNVEHDLKTFVRTPRDFTAYLGKNGNHFVFSTAELIGLNDYEIKPFIQLLHREEVEAPNNWYLNIQESEINFTHI